MQNIIVSLKYDCKFKWCHLFLCPCLPIKIRLVGLKETVHNVSCQIFHFYFYFFKTVGECPLHWLETRVNETAQVLIPCDKASLGVEDMFQSDLTLPSYVLAGRMNDAANIGNFVVPMDPIKQFFIPYTAEIVMIYIVCHTATWIKVFFSLQSCIIWKKDKSGVKWNHEYIIRLVAMFEKYISQDYTV